MSQLIPFTESGDDDRERRGTALRTILHDRGGLAGLADEVLRSRALHVALAVTPAVVAIVQTIVTRGRRH